MIMKKLFKYFKNLIKSNSSVSMEDRYKIYGYRFY